MRGRRDGRAADHSFKIRDGYYPFVRSLLGEIENKGNNAANFTNMIDLHFDTVTQKVSQAFHRRRASSYPTDVGYE